MYAVAGSCARMPVGPSVTDPFGPGMRMLWKSSPAFSSSVMPREQVFDTLGDRPGRVPVGLHGAIVLQM